MCESLQLGQSGIRWGIYYRHLAMVDSERWHAGSKLRRKMIFCPILQTYILIPTQKHEKLIVFFYWDYQFCTKTISTDIRRCRRVENLPHRKDRFKNHLDAIILHVDRKKITNACTLRIKTHSHVWKLLCHDLNYRKKYPRALFHNF